MGFGQEIKDFLGAFEAGKKIVGSGNDAEYKALRNKLLKAKADEAADPELRKAKINRLNRGPKLVDPSVIALRNKRGVLIDEQIKNARAKRVGTGAIPVPLPSAADDATPLGSGAIGKRGALDLEPTIQTSQLEEPDDEAFAGEEGALPVQMAASGGAVVRNYEDGGEVEDDDALEMADEPDAVDADALDAEDAVDAEDDESADGPVTEQGALPVSAQPTQATPANTGKTVAYSNEAAHDAVREGLIATAKATGHSGGDGAVETDPRARAQGSRSYLSGARAASPEEYQKVLKAVNPNGDLSESQANMAALSRVYTWSLDNGTAASAADAAGRLTQRMRMVSNTYKSIAIAAAENRDLDGTMKNMVRAYANVPNGDDLKLEKAPSGHINWSVTDEKGKKREGGLMTPDELLSFASRGQIPTFDDLLMQSAGGRAELAARSKKEGEAAKSADAAGKVPKLADRVKSQKMITAEAGDAADPKNKYKFSEDTAAPAKTIAAQIFRVNDISETDALALTAGMIDPAQNLPAKATEDGGVIVQLPDKREVRVSKDAYLQTTALRGRASKQAKEAAAKTTADDAASQARMKKVMAVQQPYLDQPVPPGAQTRRPIVDRANPSGGALPILR